MGKEKLPDGWKILPISKCIVDDLSGFACSQTKLVTENGYVQLRPFNIESGKLNLDTLYQVPLDIVDDKKYYLEIGDILFNNTNSTELVGKSAIAEDRYPFAFSNHINRIRVDSNVVLPKFFHNYLFYMWTKGHFAKHCKKWIGQSGYTLTNLKQQLIPIPPLDVQQEIVAKIGKQMVEIEIMKKGSEKSIEHSEKYYSSYLNSFFDDLCKDESTLVTLNDVCEIRSGQVDPKLEELKKFPHIYGKSIESGTGRLLEYNTIGEDEVTSGKYLFKAGDVLYSKLRPYLKKVIYADFDGLCSADMYPLEVDRTKINPHWLVMLLLSNDFTSYAIHQSSRARMPKLNRTQLNSWKFSLPPLYIQKTQVEQFHEVIEIINEIRDFAQFQFEAIDQLSESILNDVFGKYEIPEKV